MNFYALGAWAITAFNLGLWTFTLAKRNLNLLAKSYFWWSFFITLWSLGYGVTLSGLFDYDTTLTWNKWCQSMAVLIAPNFFRLGVAVADEFERYRKYYRIYLIFGIINAIGLFFTPLYVKELWSFGVFKYQPLGGPLYIVFAAFFFWCTIHSFIVAALKYKETSGTQRAQLRLFLWGTGIAYSGGGMLFLQAFHIPFPSYGVFPILAYVILIGYAVHKYQFLDVEFVLKRTVVFTILTAMMFGFVTLSAYVIQDLIGTLTGLGQAVSVAATIAIVLLFFHPLEDSLIYLTDKYLFQKKYDFREVLRKFMDEVMQELNLDQLVKRTVDTLSETVKLESCSLLLVNKDTRQYTLVASRGTNGQQVVLEEDEPFIKFLRQTHEPIGRDGELGKVKFPEAVTNRVKELNARLCLPMEVHDELIGVLCLGKKKSDEEFAKEDMDVLLPVAKTLAIAVSNAQLVEELQKTQAEAAQKEKLAVIGTLSAGINHEICNPLGIVKAQCEAFLIDQQDGILVGKSAQEMLERTSSIMQVALKQIDRATAITQKLSNFAKPIKEPTAQPVAVGKEIDEVLALVGHDLNLQKIEVVKEIDPNLPDITVDRRQFQEVLFNLMRNAGQAIKPPGTILVRGYVQEGRCVRIEIADTGSGMNPETLAKIYNPFFTTKEPGKGTGLGLFIVRQIVERNKGRIAVESTLGKGTTFSLEFPIGKTEPAMAAT